MFKIHRGLGSQPEKRLTLVRAKSSHDEFCFFNEAILFGRLLLLFIVVPLVDLFLLLWISKFTGLPATIGLVVLTGFIGAWLAKQQGTFVKGQIKDRLSQQQMPADLIGDGAMILFAAGLLLTPGLLTDLLGFSLLIPACRSQYKKVFAQHFKSSFNFQVFTPPNNQPRHRPDDPNVIDGEVVEKRDADDPLSGDF